MTIDVTANLAHVLKYFGLSAGDAPTVRIINTEHVIKYAIGPGEITAATLRLFCQGVLDGTVKVSYTHTHAHTHTHTHTQ